jgi:hypothetical protein
VTGGSLDRNGREEGSEGSLSRVTAQGCSKGAPSATYKVRFCNPRRRLEALGPAELVAYERSLWRIRKEKRPVWFRHRAHEQRVATNGSVGATAPALALGPAERPVWFRHRAHEQRVATNGSVGATAPALALGPAERPVWFRHRAHEQRVATNGSVGATAPALALGPAELGLGLRGGTDPLHVGERARRQPPRGIGPREHEPPVGTIRWRWRVRGGSCRGLGLSGLLRNIWRRIHFDRGLVNHQVHQRPRDEQRHTERRDPKGRLGLLGQRLLVMRSGVVGNVRGIRRFVR